jgi:hypothetical protein
MNMPITIGLPQLVLLILTIIGLALLISSLMSLFRRRAYYEDVEDEKYKFAKRYYRHHFRWARGFLGLILLLVAVCLLWFATLMQTYLALTGEIKVAHVHASTLANAPHEMNVELVLYDKNGHQTSDNSYLVAGDEWMVQGDILKVSPWLNVLGLHSGFKLTRLEGRFNDPNSEHNAKHTVVELNGGDGAFFQTAYSHQSWFAPFVDAAYGNAVFQAAGTFDIFATQDALIARPAS